MSRSDDVFRPALAGRKIPILTLDGKWHQLFNQTQPDKRIRRLEIGRASCRERVSHQV